MPPLKSLEGRRFGRLIVSHRGPNRGKRVMWVCRCDCGNTHATPAIALSTGAAKSCGCLGDEMRLHPPTNRKHGGDGTPEYRIWSNMRQRCSNPHNKSYPDYGGRGIRVCERWQLDFAAFLSDMGPRPSPLHSIDRIDVNGHYEPGNVRWATRGEQSRNRRDSRFITLDGVTKNLVDWGKSTGLGMKIIHQRIHVYGWSEEEAIKTPIVSNSESGRRACEVRYGRLSARSGRAA